jgi:hypothetical protein
MRSMILALAVLAGTAIPVFAEVQPRNFTPVVITNGKPIVVAQRTCTTTCDRYPPYTCRTTCY